MEGQKVSFGFKKTSTKKPISKPVETEKKEFIEGFEEKEVKTSSSHRQSSQNRLIIPLCDSKEKKGTAREPTDDDYFSVPVESFGAALLRGMGWNENDKRVEPKEVSLRPRGVGLGHNFDLREPESHKKQ